MLHVLNWLARVLWAEPTAMRTRTWRMRLAGIASRGQEKARNSQKSISAPIIRSLKNSSNPSIDIIDICSQPIYTNNTSVWRRTANMCSVKNPSV